MEQTDEDKAIAAALAAKAEELRLTHGKVLQVNTPKGALFFKKPTKFVWARFTNTVSNEKSDKSEALLLLSLGCLVHPSESEARKVFEEYPVLPSTLSEPLSKLGGGEGGEGFEVKAL
jgi:hypothetical protein